LLAVELIGIVPEDENVILSTNRGSPIVLDGKSQAGKAFRNIAARLDGQDIPFMTLESSNGFFGRISRMMRAGGD
jgi:septum site-determining protein MinD